MEPVISRNPATGEEVCRHEGFNPAAVAEAVLRARAAQSRWGALTFDERIEYLKHAQRYMLGHLDEISQAISKNNGKPLVQALAEVVPMIQTISFFAKQGKKILRDQKMWLGSSLPTKMATISYKPLGVVGIISPWNYPFSTPVAEILLGLACGNAVVFKPSEVTGLVNEQILKVTQSMNLPENVFTMIHGGAEVGAALARSEVNRLIVTGSVGTGKKVMEAASQQLTPVTLELGGKDCMIVLEDADIDKAASAAVVGGFYNTGQTCCSVEKLLVHEAVKMKFMEKFLEKLSKLRQGPSVGFDNDLGPVTFEGQKKTYYSQLADHKQSNHATIFGPTDFDGRANFMKPLIVDGGDGRLFWREETFGPVVAVRTFKNEDEAVEINNNSKFGLTAVIWSADTNRARKLARRLHVGTVVINDGPFTNAIACLPWGGVGDSGFGWVHGEMGLKELCQAQVVTYDLAGQQKQFWWFPHNKAQYEFFKHYVGFLAGEGFGARISAFINMIKSLLKMGPRL